MKTLQERFFSIHGVGLTVQSDTPEAIAAIDMRLRDFRGDDVDRKPAVSLRLLEMNAARSGWSLPAGRCVYETPAGSLYYDADGDVLAGTFGGVSVRCDASEGTVEMISSDLRDQNLYFATHPLLTVCLMELLERRSLFCLHAAALAGQSGEGILLCGPSGAGKSTLALGLALDGFAFLSDDIVWLSRPEPGARLRVLSFPDTIGVTAATARHFPSVSALAGEPAVGFPKRLERIEEVTGRRSVSSCTPRSVIFTEVVHGRPSRLSVLPAAEAFLRLVPDVLLTEPTSTQDHLGAIAGLLEGAGTYALESGSDLHRAVQLVGELI